MTPTLRCLNRQASSKTIHLTLERASGLVHAWVGFFLRSNDEYECIPALQIKERVLSEKASHMVKLFFRDSKDTVKKQKQSGKKGIGSSESRGFQTKPGDRGVFSLFLFASPQLDARARLWPHLLQL